MAYLYPFEYNKAKCCCLIDSCNVGKTIISEVALNITC